MVYLSLYDRIQYFYVLNKKILRSSISLSTKVSTMKNILTLILATGCTLFSIVPHNIYAAIEDSPKESASSKPDTQQNWLVLITPRIRVDSYASEESTTPALSGPSLHSLSGKSVDSIVISPRIIPLTIPKKLPCLTQRTCLRNRHSANRNSFPWLLNYTFGNQYSTPALDLYSDFVRSDWYGSPYQGNYFYNQGYRPSFRFGSLQFRGFGNYDRMYNPRIIPFGYQYAGSRTYYAALALTSMYSTSPW